MGLDDCGKVDQQFQWYVSTPRPVTVCHIHAFSFASAISPFDLCLRRGRGTADRICRQQLQILSNEQDIFEVKHWCVIAFAIFMLAERVKCFPRKQVDGGKCSKTDVVI